MHALHPLNVGFTWRSAPASPRWLSAAQCEQFDRDGYCVVEHAFSADELATLTAAIDPWETHDEDFVRSQPDGELFIAKADAISFTVHLVARSEVCRDFTCHPALLGVVGDLVGSPARLYWDQAVYKKPEPSREFPWHQDNGYAFIDPQQYITCWIPLTDATVDNGCPWIVPGVHRCGSLVHLPGAYGLTCFDDPTDAEAAIAVEAPAGSMVVFSSLTPHRTGPNVTNDVRKAYIVQYAPDGAVVRRSADRSTDERADHPARQFLVG